jgi:DNA invertase Pin-like site-specific DNA recombinase
MAKRGKPLPFEMKQEIKQRHSAGEPLRKIAEALGISKTTAQQFGTKPLQRKRQAA